MTRRARSVLNALQLSPVVHFSLNEDDGSAFLRLANGKRFNLSAADQRHVGAVRLVFEG